MSKPVSRRPVTRKITKEERILYSPILTDEHDYCGEYKCQCGKTLLYYSVDRPGRLMKCAECTFNSV